MEAVDGNDTGPGALLTSMESTEIERTLLDDLQMLPRARGANNHMGSLFTADEKGMEVVLRILRERGLFFLDSYTTKDSAVQKSCRRMGIPYRKRDIFIDNEQDEEKMLAALYQGLEVAESEGHAVLIGHVWSDGLPAVLKRFFRDERLEDFDIAYLSELFNEEITE
jgi:polysaccharide deacetylase 2 family uncharacterized protein YibQ